MTFAAFLLQLGMPVDDRPRHDELFEQVLRLHRRRKRLAINTPISRTIMSRRLIYEPPAQKKCAAKM